MKAALVAPLDLALGALSLSKGTGLEPCHPAAGGCLVEDPEAQLFQAEQPCLRAFFRNRHVPLHAFVADDVGVRITGLALLHHRQLRLRSITVGVVDRSNTISFLTSSICPLPAPAGTRLLARQVLHSRRHLEILGVFFRDQNDGLAAARN